MSAGERSSGAVRYVDATGGVSDGSKSSPFVEGEDGAEVLIKMDIAYGNENEDPEERDVRDVVGGFVVMIRLGRVTLPPPQKRRRVPPL